MQRHCQCSGHVIVTSPRRSQPVRRIRHELSVRSRGENTQPFEDSCHLQTIQAVVAMFALGEHFNQPRRLQPIQVYARRRRAYASHDRQFGTSARAAIQQAVKHASSRRLADRHRNPGDRSVRMAFCIHTSMLNEVFVRGKRHTFEHDHHVRHSLPDRPLPTRGIQDIRRKLGPHHSAVRRPSDRIFPSP